MRTDLSDGGRAAEDEDGLARVLGLAAVLPGRGDGGGQGVGMVHPEAGGDGRDCEVDGRGLVEGDVLWDLCGARWGVLSCARRIVWGDLRRRTFTVRSAGVIRYCWKQSPSFLKLPSNMLSR